MVSSRKLSVAISTAAASLGAFLIISCGDGSRLGAPVPADAPAATLTALNAAPADFNGKKVVMNGIISAQCPSLCEFTYKEGTQSTLVYPMGFKFPKLKAGRPVKLYAEITSGSGQVVVSALGMELK